MHGLSQSFANELKPVTMKVCLTFLLTNSCLAIIVLEKHHVSLTADMENVTGKEPTFFFKFSVKSVRLSAKLLSSPYTALFSYYHVNLVNHVNLS